MKQPTQRDLQAENRRSQILDLALILFAERGVENVSIKDLATEAKVAQGLIYYYFESKEALLAAVFQRHDPFPAVQEITHRIMGKPVLEGLTQFTQQLAELMLAKRNVFRLLLRELISPKTGLLDQAVVSQSKTVMLLANYFQERVTAGDLRPHNSAIPIQMLISSFVINLMADQPLDRLGQQLIDILLEGIRAP